MRALLEVVRPQLETQWSLITRRQALDGGLTRAGIDRLVRDGIWEVLDRALYGPTGVPMTWHRQLMAAVLAAPLGATASHRSCAHLHGVGGLVDPPIEISIPRGSRFRRRGVVAHESRDLGLARRVVVEGIPTTDLRRLAVDLGAVVSEARYRHTIREIRHAHGVTADQLLATYLAHRRRGRNGGGALRDWLDRYYDISGVSESGLELIALDAILDAGLPAPVRQHWVESPSGRYRLDLAYVDRLVCIEIDGAQHEDADQSRIDERRTSALEALGWRVLRVRSAHFASDMHAVLRELDRIWRQTN